MSRFPLLFAAALAIAAAPPSRQAANPWNGDWVVDLARSSADAKEGAAEGYRFAVSGNHIRWEIPSLGEVVDAPLDGKPVPIVRKIGNQPGQTLSVRAEGPGVFVYSVAQNGRVMGEGRMTLIDGNSAWVDLVRRAGAPYWNAEIVYRRR